jgi:hypothetical protein
MAAYTGSTFSVNQFASVIINTLGPGYLGVGVRESNSTNSGYLLNADSAGIGLIKLVAGTPTSLATSGAAVHAGDSLRLTVDSTTLTGYLNGVVVVTATDSTFSSGYPGLAAADTAGGGVTNFLGGDLQFTSNALTTAAKGTYSVLAACNSNTEGGYAAVTNSTTNTWGATVAGGGSDHVLAYCDGSNWTVAAQ